MLVPSSRFSSFSRFSRGHLGLIPVAAAAGPSRPTHGLSSRRPRRVVPFFESNNNPLTGRSEPWSNSLVLRWSNIRVGPGFPLQGWGCPSKPRWTPGRPCLGKASPDRFDSGSFFLPCFGREVWAKADGAHDTNLASVWEGALLLTHGSGREHSLDDRIPVKLRGWRGLSPRGYPATTGPTCYAKAPSPLSSDPATRT